MIFTPSCWSCAIVWLCVCVPVQRVTCGTWVLLRWSLWRVTRRFRRPPRRPSPWCRPRRPPWSTSKCRRRASRSPTTRGSKCSTAETRHLTGGSPVPSPTDSLCLPLQAVLQKTLRRQHRHLLLFGSAGTQVSGVELPRPLDTHVVLSWSWSRSSWDFDMFWKFQQTMCVSEVVSIVQL